MHNLILLECCVGLYHQKTRRGYQGIRNPSVPKLPVAPKIASSQNFKAQIAFQFYILNCNFMGDPNLLRIRLVPNRLRQRD